jgi:hypothetical protein
MDKVCKEFLGIGIYYLGYVEGNDAVPRSIVEQKVLANEEPLSRIGINCSAIARALFDWRP